MVEKNVIKCTAVTTIDKLVKHGKGKSKADLEAR